MEDHFVKIYGARRTGTNFIQTLIKKNCINTECFDNAFGDKHGIPLKNIDHFFKKIEVKNPKMLEYYKKVYEHVKSNSALHCIIIIKNPYSWYHSIKKFSTRGGKFAYNFELVYNRYNTYYTSYIEFYNNPQSFGEHYGKIFVIRYEDLLANPKQEVSTICNKCNIPLKKEFTVPDKIHMSRKFTESRKQFYLQKNTTFGLPKEAVRDINNIIDWEIMNFYGYERIDV